MQSYTSATGVIAVSGGREVVIETVHRFTTSFATGTRSQAITEQSGLIARSFIHTLTSVLTSVLSRGRRCQ